MQIRAQLNEVSLTLNASGRHVGKVNISGKLAWEKALHEIVLITKLNGKMAHKWQRIKLFALVKHLLRIFSSVLPDTQT